MSIDRTVPTQQSATARPRSRFSVPRGLIVGTLIAIALSWGLFESSPDPACCRASADRHLPRPAPAHHLQPPRQGACRPATFQRCVTQPADASCCSRSASTRYGLAILETRGHRTGKTRRVPVGNGRKGDSFWIIAEHGTRAGYVHNIQHDPHVRVRLRLGLRYRWVDGIATVRPDEDPLARQRRVIAWHPLRALNAMYVRVLGADLLAVHVQLALPGRETAADPQRTRAPGQAGGR